MSADQPHSNDEPRGTHHWHIDDDEYLRHEERRGKRYAYGQCEPVATCLVVVDMVDFFTDGSHYAAGIVPTIDRVTATLRKRGGHVAWVVPEVAAPTDWQVGFYGPEIAERYAASGGSGTPSERITADLDVQPADVVVEKSRPSAFFTPGCELHDRLQARGVRRVLIAGTVTSVCCESTARDAAALGYEVVVLADATADVSDDAHNASLRTIYRSFGDVRTADEAVAGTPNAR